MKKEELAESIDNCNNVLDLLFSLKEEMDLNDEENCKRVEMESIENTIEMISKVKQRREEEYYRMKGKRK